MTLLDLQVALGQMKTEIEQKGFDEAVLNWIYPSVEGADAEKCNELFCSMLESEKVHPSPDAAILYKVVYNIFFKGQHTYKKGTQFDWFHSRVMQELPSSSRLQLALEELDFWAFK